MRAVPRSQYSLEIENAICPPSSGWIGNRFKTSSLKFNENIKTKTLLSAVVKFEREKSRCGRTIGCRESQKTPAERTAGKQIRQMRALEIGPAAVVQNSERKFGPGETNAKPPNGHIRISSPSPPVALAPKT